MAAVGRLLVGLNVARRALGVPVRWYSIILATSLLVAGIGVPAGTRIDAFVVFFVLLGAVSIIGAIVLPARSAAA